MVTSILAVLQLCARYAYLSVTSMHFLFSCCIYFALYVSLCDHYFLCTIWSIVTKSCEIHFQVIRRLHSFIKNLQYRVHVHIQSVHEK